MKIIAVLLFAFCMHVHATGYSQTVTLQLKNVPLTTIFAEIKNQTGYSFVYTREDLQKAKNVDIDVTHSSIEEALGICFVNQPLTYTILEKMVVIKQKSVSSGISDVPPVEIKGRITNPQGEPLANANVIIKRTKRGTQTNVNGEFVLRTATQDDIITVSFTGYKSQSVKIGDNNSINLVMQIATDELDKIVVQAYGTTTQRFSTGNISTVTAKEIERQPVMNPILALEGRVPGLVVTTTSGYASAPIKVEIRGRSSINPNLPSEPLYIIDGVPLTILESPSLGGNYETGSLGVTQNGFTGPAGGQSPLFSLNPSEIESITVLKDADATAIYGSRGSNGVIVITTKKGQPGRTKFELSAYTGISKVTKHHSLLNTQQYLSMRREAFRNDGIIPDIGNAYDLVKWDTTRYTDYQKELWGGTGKDLDLHATISGGDKLTNFRVAGDYHRETGIMNYTGADQRGAIQLNLTHKSSNQHFRVSFTNNYSYSQSDYINLSPTVLIAPNSPAFLDAQGKLNWKDWLPTTDVSYFSVIFSPYTAKSNFLNSALTLNYEIFKGLNLSTDLGYSTIHNSQIQIYPIISKNPLDNPTGSSVFGNNNNSNAIVEPKLEYNGLLGKGKLNVLVAGSGQSSSMDGNTIFGDGYVNDNLLRSVANAPIKGASDISIKYKYAAFFGRINYNWENKYILNLSARRDGSSRFGPGKQYGNFWAIGGAWIFTEESLIKNHFSFLSFGKLRGSYGLTGSDRIGDYNFLTHWTGATLPYQGQSAYTPLIHANPDLQWEVNRKLEVALNLGFFKDRLSIEVSWYRNRSGDQLLDYRLPIITGFNTVAANLPAEVQNSGWEISFGGKLFDQKNFSWSMRFNVGFNKNKLLSYPNLDQSPYFGQFIIGQPLNISRVLHLTGVDPKTGKYTYEDKNKDGIINPYDYTGTTGDLFIQDRSVRSDGGFATEVRYKNLQLSLFFHFKQQLRPSAIFNSTPGGLYNQSSQVLNRWQKPGDHAKFARFTTQPEDSDSFLFLSDGIFSDASFIRLQNLSLTYELPLAWAKRAGMQNANIYFHGQNLFVLSKYNGIDPGQEGLSLGAIPPAKMFTFGIQFNF
ncbi:MAG: SusC/RagA family TonB-linked outer membrane protein [Bacteroidetes bacterium]|nr:SusC/RagA family TonB-linked outer membrane protein [Bacteroidota bacterium]